MGRLRLAFWQWAVVLLLAAALAYGAVRLLFGSSTAASRSTGACSPVDLGQSAPVRKA